MVFEGHAAQLPAPAVALYVPAMHAAQIPDPTALLCVPASHALHATPSEAAVYPTTHLQSIKSMLPAAELVCEGHAVQPPAPAVALYFPAKHALHATPSDVPLYPGRHVQSTNSLLASEETVFEGHAAQVPAPTVALYVSAKHALHGPPSAPVKPAEQ
jgi:hypothetical protein